MSSVYDLKYAQPAVLDFDYMVKLIVVGASGVGKSSLLLQFTDREFQKSIEATVGVEFGVKVLEVDGLKVKLQIWDTGGQESFRSVTTNYYRGAQGGLLVFDLTYRISFDALPGWLKEIHAYTDPNTSFLLIGNKKDLAGQRVVSYEEAEDFAVKNGLVYIETSAKDSTNVDKAFQALCKTICENIATGKLETPKRSTILTNDEKSPPPKDEGGCCS